MIKKLVFLTLLLAATVSGALTPRNVGAAVICPDDCRPDDCCRNCWFQFGTGCVCSPEYICF